MRGSERGGRAPGYMQTRATLMFTVEMTAPVLDLVLRLLASTHLLGLKVLIKQI